LRERRRGLSNDQSFHVNIRIDDAGYFVARCVELPAAMTQARTEEEVIRRIKEAIHLVLKATRQEETKELALTAIELVA
jgi:predicted RNase H-like HicB family nuclease